MSYLVNLLLLLLFFTKLSHQKELNFVIYYQGAQHDVPYISEDIFKELDTTAGDASRNYRRFNHSEELNEFQRNCGWKNILCCNPFNFTFPIP